MAPQRVPRLSDRIPLILLYHPFEVAVAVVTFMVGMTLLLAGAGSDASGLGTVPTWLTRAWQVQMALAGPLVLLGMLWKGRDISLAMGIERAGLYLTASGWATRAMVLLLSHAGDDHINGWAGVLVSSAMYITIAIAAQLRAVSVKRTLRAAQRVAAADVAST